MIDILNKSNCTGCYACVNSCPVQCITMKEDEEGFEYPTIDMKKCINCNICEKTCPSLNKDLSSNTEAVYAAKNKDDQIRKSSSSGGVFTLIAEYILKMDGVVYGASYDEKFEVRHIRINSLDEIAYLKGAKYVQSKIDTIYQMVKKDLEANKIVLFTGTPCQIAGVRAFLKRPYEKLYLQDVLCHGVPSYKILKKYLDETGFKDIKSISFRDKSIGWQKSLVRIDYKNKTYKQKYSQNPYTRAFSSGAILRPSCYQCHYKNMRYYSDISLSDFWGIENTNSKLYDQLGVSLMFIHTDKGMELFHNIKSFMEYEEVELETAIASNKTAIYGAYKQKNRDVIFEQLDKKSLRWLTNRYVKGSILKRAYNLFHRNCLRILKRG
ncbi:MAG: Coenzyme F420 hydrogenase/dehydrogenase, beta subunit C-terminal domain [bacterium]|nr:Coenzyme F420 hydrogenase/dehydrogenase, beta subunit C-terminal domain [bacterium]